MPSASRASACGRRSMATNRCSKRICSTSTAISTETASKSNSWQNCATRKSSTDLDAMVRQIDRDAAQARANPRLRAKPPVFERLKLNVHRLQKHDQSAEDRFAMKADLAKREPGMLAEWEKPTATSEIQERTAEREHAFILHDGPPYANGVIHIGHAVNKILKDIVVKSKLLAGFRSPYVPGWDCHGLPIEIAVEKKVGKVGQKVDAGDIPRNCAANTRRSRSICSATISSASACSATGSNPYRTMDFQYEADMIRALAKSHANAVTSCAASSRCTGASIAARRSPKRRSNITTSSRRRSTSRTTRSIRRRSRRSSASNDRRRRHRRGADLDDDAMDAAGELAVSLGPELEYTAGQGPPRGDARAVSAGRCRRALGGALSKVR